MKQFECVYIQQHYCYDSILGLAACTTVFHILYAVDLKLHVSLMMESSTKANKLLHSDACINETGSRESVSVPVVPRPLEEKVLSSSYCSCVFCKMNGRLLNFLSIRHGTERLMGIN